MRTRLMGSGSSTWVSFSYSLRAPSRSPLWKQRCARRLMSIAFSKLAFSAGRTAASSPTAAALPP